MQKKTRLGVTAIKNCNFRLNYHVVRHAFEHFFFLAGCFDMHKMTRGLWVTSWVRIVIEYTVYYIVFVRSMQ